MGAASHGFQGGPYEQRVIAGCCSVLHQSNGTKAELGRPSHPGWLKCANRIGGKSPPAIGDVGAAWTEGFMSRPSVGEAFFVCVAFLMSSPVLLAQHRGHEGRGGVHSGRIS